MECSDPIVVFVWYKETSSMLQAALLGLKSNFFSDIMNTSFTHAEITPHEYVFTNALILYINMST